MGGPDAEGAPQFAGIRVDGLEDRIGNRYREAIRETGLPPLAYAYSHLEAGPGGCMWARIMTPSLLEAGVWHVYDAEGVFQGIVRTPERFVVHAIVDDGVVGIWFDGFEVEHLAKYRFVEAPVASGGGSLGAAHPRLRGRGRTPADPHPGEGADLQVDRAAQG